MRVGRGLGGPRGGRARARRSARLASGRSTAARPARGRHRDHAAVVPRLAVPGGAGGEPPPWAATCGPRLAGRSGRWGPCRAGVDADGGRGCGDSAAAGWPCRHRRDGRWCDVAAGVRRPRASPLSWSVSSGLSWKVADVGDESRAGGSGATATTAGRQPPGWWPRCACRARRVDRSTGRCRKRAASNRARGA